MKSLPTWIFLFSLIICNVYGLHSHRQESYQDQLTQLKKQQSNFETKINDLIDNINQIEKNFNNTSNNTKKVLILENGIISERESINEIQKTLIPQFNISQCTCDELTDQQKINLLDEITKARDQVYQLRNLSEKIQPCDELTQINADLDKELFFLNSMESILYTQCKTQVILSPTIFQTNIYAKNWILGPQTIDDVIEEYYQRSITYNNVTNCPLLYPFFDGKKCIQCTTDNPVFNMYTRTCQACQEDYDVDNDLKKCVLVTHYTNFTSLQNYGLDGADSLPQIPADAAPCRSSKPYYNGIHCVSCQLPSYWSVKDAKCKDCDPGQKFTINLKQCKIPLNNTASILSNTAWVTNDGNLTRVLDDRVQLLGKKSNFTYCPSQNPFFDQIACINCGDQQFNVDENKCVQVPNSNYIYNQNTKQYIMKQDNLQTNLRSGKRYISTNILLDTPIKNCPSDRPFYNGIGCVACLYPFDIFDADAKQCRSCDPQKVYNSTLHSCVDRPIFYAPQNFDKLMATDKVTIQDYFNKFQRAQNSTSQQMIFNCEDQNAFSTIFACITCDSQYYFNVQTMKCDLCDGRLDNSTRKCLEKAYIFTNLNATNIVDINNDPKTEQQKIQTFLKQHPTSFVCPILTPYSNNITCIKCTAGMLFNYTSQKCVNCPQNLLYDSKLRQCVPFVYLTNTNKTNILLPQGKTIEQYLTQQNKSAGQKPTLNCPISAPYTADGIVCFNCKDPNPVFDTSTKTCFSCPAEQVYDLSSYSCNKIYYISNPAANNFVESGNDTLSKLRAEQTRIKKQQTYKVCDKNTPYAVSGGCLNCSGNKPLFNLTTKMCTSCPYPEIYVQNISKCVYYTKIGNLSAPNYIQVGNYTLDSVKKQQDQIISQKLPIQNCTGSTPYSNLNQCLSCNSTAPYFNLKTLKCQNCPKGQVYYSTQRKCTQLISLTNITEAKKLNYTATNVTLAQIQKMNTNISKTVPTQVCPAQKPFVIAGNCGLCPVGQQYSFDSSKCQACLVHMTYDPKLHVCTAMTPLTNTQYITNYAEVDNYTKDNIQTQNKKLESNLTYYCPKDQPYSDGKKCIACDSPLHFNLKTLNCTACPKGNIYNFAMFKCRQVIPRYSNLTNTNWIVSKGSVDSITEQRDRVQAIDGSQECQYKFQFYNSSLKDCSGCNTGQLFDYSTNICTKCSTGTVFDINIHQCLPPVKKNTYQTSLDSDNLIYGGISEAEWQDYYDSNKTAYPNIQDCPQQAPYFDGINCIQCPKIFPYFNMRYKLCQICPQNTSYNEDFKACQNSQGQQVSSPPNIAKMYASIF